MIGVLFGVLGSVACFIILGILMNFYQEIMYGKPAEKSNDGKKYLKIEAEGNFIERKVAKYRREQLVRENSGGDYW